MNESPKIINASDWAQQLVIADLPFIVWKGRWLLVLGALLGGVVGLGIVASTKAVYTANALIQVEIRTNSARATQYMEMTEALGLNNPAEGEAAVIVSRSVIGQAIRSINADLKIQPHRRIVDRLLRRPEPILDIARFSLPDSLTGVPFVLRLVSQTGGYEIHSLDGQLVLKGVVGKEVDSLSNRWRLGLMVRGVYNAVPGQTFRLERQDLEDVVSDVSAELKAEEHGKKTALIDLSIKSRNPRAAEIVNAVSKYYLQQEVERRQSEAAERVAYLEQQLPELKASLDSSESRLSGFKLGTGSVNLTEEISMTLSFMQNLRQQQLALEDRRNEALQSYRPDHPSVKTLDSSLALIRTELESQQRKLQLMPSTEKALLRLSRQVETDAQRYLEVQREAQQFRIVQTQKFGNARIIDSAVVSVSNGRAPSSVMGLALVGGLFVAVLGAVGIHYAKGGIGAPDLIEAATWSSVLALLPAHSEQKRLDKLVASGEKGGHVLAIRNPYEFAVESVRGLRASIFNGIQQHPQNKAILVSSPTPRCGKSFVASNLAVTLAQAGVKTALVDADFVNGELHRQFGCSRSKGLVEYFSGSAGCEEILTAVNLPMLTLVTAGSVAPRPGFAPSREAFNDLLSNLSKLFDVVIVDGPPLLSVANAATLAQASGAVLLVLRHDAHTLGEVVDCRKKLQQIDASLLGVVLNQIDPMASINGRRFVRQMVKYGAPKT